MSSFANFQLPLLCGLPFLEKSASQTAHWIAGRSGKHLFLTDNDDGKPPLLLQMVNDFDDLHFMLVLIFLAAYLYISIVNKWQCFPTASADNFVSYMQFSFTFF